MNLLLSCQNVTQVIQLTRKSQREFKFLSRIPMYTLVMADQSFNIEECLARNITSYKPPARKTNKDKKNSSPTHTATTSNRTTQEHQDFRTRVPS